MEMYKFDICEKVKSYYQVVYDLPHKKSGFHIAKWKVEIRVPQI